DLCAEKIELCAEKIDLCVGKIDLCAAGKDLCAEKIDLCAAGKDLCAEKIDLFFEEIDVFRAISEASLKKKRAGSRRYGPAIIERGRHYAVKSRTDGLLNPAGSLVLPFPSLCAEVPVRATSPPPFRVSPQISPPTPRA